MCKTISRENLTIPVKTIGTTWPFGKWTLEGVLGKTIESKRRWLYILWFIVPVSRIQVNWFCDKEMVWQEKDIPDADATLAVAFNYELEILFTRVNRFWICSWEKTMLGVLEFRSKTTILFAADNLWELLPIVSVEINIFPLGPFHLGGYPISWKHLSTRCPE